ncbi:MAG: hypothetical protein AAGA53_02210 [Pseudomonadota bacterium]
MQIKNQSGSAPVFSVPKLLFWSALLYAAWHWKNVSPVLLQGELPGPDDFLRLHLVQSWLAGKSWFDASIAGFLGSDIHWSRIIDVPLAMIALPLTLVLESALALRVTAVVWPFFLFLSGMLVMMKICDQLCGKQARVFVLLFTGLNSFTMHEFAPGRIDHHNAQIIVLLLAVYGLFLQNSWKRALLIGLSIPLSVSIGLEILVLFLAILAGLALEWALSEKPQDRTLQRTGMIMGAACLVFYMMTIPPDEYVSAYCDEYSIVYLSALLGISVCFLVLQSSQGWLDRFTSNQALSRILSGIVLAGILAVSLIGQFPHCLAGPLGEMNPELVRRWLAGVSEAKGIFETVNASPERWISGIGYIGLMLLIGIAVAIRRWKQHPHLVTLFAVLALCVITSFWQMRVLRTGIFASIPFIVIFALIVMHKIRESLGRDRLSSKLLQALVCVVLTSYTWTLAATHLAKPMFEQTPISAETQTSSGQTCFAKRDYLALSGLPEGLVMSDLNSAAPIAVHTHHRVISGPYHRNTEEILLVYDFFQSPEVAAKRLAQENKIDYVALCLTAGSIPILEKTHLNALIQRDALPPWLNRVSSRDEKLVVLEVQH